VTETSRRAFAKLDKNKRIWRLLVKHFDKTFGAAFPAPPAKPHTSTYSAGALAFLPTSA
jgi:hypothetical protein